MTDDLNQCAAGLLGNGLGQLVFLFLEIDELDLDQLMEGQLRVDASDESRADAVAANFEDRFEELRLAPEAAAIGGGELRCGGHDFDKK
jgi:hypothetical protein